MKGLATDATLNCPFSGADRGYRPDIPRSTPDTNTIMDDLVPASVRWRLRRGGRLTT